MNGIQNAFFLFFILTNQQSDSHSYNKKMDGAYIESEYGRKSKTLSIDGLGQA